MREKRSGRSCGNNIPESAGNHLIPSWYKTLLNSPKLLKRASLFQKQEMQPQGNEWHEFGVVLLREGLWMWDHNTTWFLGSKGVNQIMLLENTLQGAGGVLGESLCELILFALFWNQKNEMLLLKVSVLGWSVLWVSGGAHILLCFFQATCT